MSKMAQEMRSEFGLPRNGSAPPAYRDVRPRFTADYSIRSVLDDLGDFLAIFWQGKYWIVAAVIACLIPAALYLILTPSTYRATAQIMLDPQPIKLVEGAVVPSGLGQSSVGADTLLVDSQTEIITSPPVLGPVVRKEKLFEDSEFYKPYGLGLRMRMRNLVGVFIPGFQPERLPDTDVVAQAMGRFAGKHLEVKRVGNTYLINVSVLSTDAEKSARLANAVAKSYIDDRAAFLSKTTRTATADLEGRIKELRERVREAEDKVEVFRAENGLLGTPGLLVNEQQLQDLNGRMAEARAATSLAKARYERLQGNTAESIAAGNTTETQNNRVIVNLRALLAQAERRLSGLAGELGPSHPSLIKARQERRSVLRLIEQELTRIRAVAKSEYDLARTNEASLEQKFSGAMTRVSENKSSLVTLRELEREAGAAKAVLESFLVRAKETSEQESLSRPSSRIIAEAGVPQRPSAPPAKLIAAAALICGLFAGACLVWLRHVMAMPPAPSYVLNAGYDARVNEEGPLIEYSDPPAPEPDVIDADAVRAFQERLDRLSQQSRRLPPQLGTGQGPV